MLALVLAQNSPALQRLENLTLDLRFRARAAFDPPASRHLLWVGIDEASLDTFGRWPWPREILGQFGTLLAAFGPRVVALDLLFTERDTGNPEGDLALAAGLGALGSAITGALLSEAPPTVTPGKSLTTPLPHVVGQSNKLYSQPFALRPIPELSELSHFGFIDSHPNTTDGIRRRVPLVVRVGHEYYPSLALQAVMLYWNVAPEQVEVELGNMIRLHSPGGVRTIPITEFGEILLNNRNTEGFTYWSLAGLFRALLLDASEETPLAEDHTHPRDKILVLGQTAVGLTDFGPSPLSSWSPLVLTWLNAINSILNEDYLTSIPLWPWPLAAWLAIAWASLFLLNKGAVRMAILAPLLIAAGYIGICLVVFMTKSTVLPLALPILGFASLHTASILLRWREEIAERRIVSEELARTAEEKKRLEQELQIAREIQMSTLPLVFPAFPERLDIGLHATVEPAKLVGGDLFDFYFIDAHRLFFVLGDVAGKGLPASLFMTMALSVFRAHAAQGLSPDENLRRSNDVLAMRNPRCTFVTTFCGLLDLRTGWVEYANGGHNPPVHLLASGELRFLEEEGVALGALEEMEYTKRELLLAPGEGLLLYTDGVTEAENPESEQFEPERMINSLAHGLPLCVDDNGRRNAAALTAYLRKDLADFVREAPPSDDITILAILYFGPQRDASAGTGS